MNALALGMPGLTSASGTSLAEAAAVCLEHREHQSEVALHLIGMRIEQLAIGWTRVDDQMRRTYNDLQEATERGACGIAILVLQHLTGKVVVERSRKGPGFDYWLGNDDDEPLFSGKARLEVSGILTGTASVIQSRLRQKKEQIKPSGHLAPGYVAVVEFGMPTVCVEQT